MANNMQKFGTRETITSIMVNEVGTIDNLRLENQLTKLTSMMRQLAIDQHQPIATVKACGAKSKCKVLTHLGTGRRQSGLVSAKCRQTVQRWTISVSDLKTLQSVSALGVLMAIAKGLSVATPRIYRIATSSIGRDYVQANFRFSLNNR
ncbi:hypothetical protein CR513_00903, partial [Mucuna pruriens]